MTVSKNQTPMMEQYTRLKKEYPGTVLFFRLGDFYEMFGDDAVEISALLNLTLTSRVGLPMCGIPYHAYRSYAARLLNSGKKIAICEQVTSPGKGLMERRVTEVLTPGTIIDDDYLDKGSVNYLACLYTNGKSFSLAYIDLCSGNFRVTNFSARDNVLEKFNSELEKIKPKEMIVQESLFSDYPEIVSVLLRSKNIMLNRNLDWVFNAEKYFKSLCRQFHVENLKSFGISNDGIEIYSAGAILEYLNDTAKHLLPHIKKIDCYSENEYLGLDANTIRNLELVNNLRREDNTFCLFEILNQTRTSAGARLLKTRLLHPLMDISKINKRLDFVDIFFEEKNYLSLARTLLTAIPDLERLTGKLAMDKAHGKDLLALKNALSSVFDAEKLINNITFEFEAAQARSFTNENLQKLIALHKVLEDSIHEDASILLTEGKLIKPCYDEGLSRLLELHNNGRKLLEEYLESEKQKTQISKLKIQYNRLIGYFFEVSKSSLNKVPDYFIKRSGTISTERFTTDALINLESEINGAENKIVELEKEIFLNIREKCKALISEIYAAALRLSELDVASSLAYVAALNKWTRPKLTHTNDLSVKESRHPVVEANIERGSFIPNDICLDSHGKNFAVITGPNMAGKSTYLRQTALLFIMAQMGSYVAGSASSIGIADKIFCRVGAEDNLAAGESTFLVEMNETAYILNTASEKSLIIMDEVGRGTGTNDGLSIAQAVCEDILNRIKCRTLFATHYHQLSKLAHPALTNRSMEVEEYNGEIIFKRKLREGESARSYGIYVARLAGLSEHVLLRAQEIMSELENDENNKMPYLEKPKNNEVDLLKNINRTIKVESGMPEKGLFDI